LGAQARGNGNESGAGVKTLWKKLQNPFALVGQGFLVGGLLVWTSQAGAAGFLTRLF